MENNTLNKEKIKVGNIYRYTRLNEAVIVTYVAPKYDKVEVSLDLQNKTNPFYIHPAYLDLKLSETLKELRFILQDQSELQGSVNIQFVNPIPLISKESQENFINHRKEQEEEMFFGKDNIERIKQRRHGIGGGVNPYKSIFLGEQSNNFTSFNNVWIDTRDNDKKDNKSVDTVMVYKKDKNDKNYWGILKRIKKYFSDRKNKKFL